MHELSVHEITRVAQAAWGALSYILPGETPAKAWQQLTTDERAVMQNKVQLIMDEAESNIADRITGFAAMGPEEMRKHIVIANIVSALMIDEADLKRWFAYALGARHEDQLPLNPSPASTTVSPQEPAEAGGSTKSTTPSTSPLPPATSSESAPGNSSAPQPQSGSQDTSSGPLSPPSPDSTAGPEPKGATVTSGT